MRSWTLRVIGLLLSLSILAACSATKPGGGSSGSATQYELKLGTINTDTSPDGKAAAKFKELVEAKSKGQLKINIFPNSQLGATTAQMDGVRLGTQDILMAGMELYEKWAPDLRILSVFYVFRDDAQFTAFFQSDQWKSIEQQLEKANLTFINRKYNWVTGPYRVLVTTKPVQSLDDLKGMKLRMPEVATLQKSWTALGALPVTITFAETYLAMKQDIVAGVEVPLSIVRANKFTEVGKHVTVVKTFPQRMGLTMNAGKLKTLPADLQKVLLEAADEAGVFYSEDVAKTAADDLKAMKEQDGVKVYEPDLAPWRAKIAPFVTELESTGYLTKGLYAKIQALK